MRVSANCGTGIKIFATGLGRKMKNIRFPVLFCADEHYAPHLGTALYSLLANNTALRLKILIITPSLTRESAQRLKQIGQDFSTPLRFARAPNDSLSGLPLGHHFTYTAYLRLFAANVIRGKQCLYLDSDLVVTGSIAELISRDIADYHLAAIENPGFDRHEELGLTVGAKYFNSGVMLINLERWRRENIQERVIDFSIRNPERVKYADQCGLNAIVDGNWLAVSRNYNFQTRHSVALGAEAKIDPAIIHFTGSSKPWEPHPHTYKDIYWAYRQKNPFRVVPNEA